MKRMKKFASLLLALVMVLSLANIVLAEGNGSITIENPIEGQTYTAYKIFDVVYSDNKDAYSYTISSNSEWLSTIQNYKEIALSDLITDADGNSFYVVTKTNQFSASEFSAVLNAAVAGKTGTVLSNGTVNGLALGYYFVKSNTGALCNLTTTDPDAVIRDKNDMPFDKTVDDTNGVELGQTVNFEITGAVPDTTGFTTYTYTITDEMSDGLSFNKDVVVKIDETTINITSYITYKETGFELNIPVTEYQDQIGKVISVKYSAVVNENAVASVANNFATLTYTNNPNGSTTTATDLEKVFSAEVVIDKYKTGATTTKLEGAEFVLINSENKYYNLTEGSVTWVESLDGATVVTTDANGAASFEGLENGTYQLKEIKAPAGYNMLDKTIEVVINGNNAGSGLTVTKEVANSTGAILPETGGMGTTIFYVVGSIMVLAAVILLVTKKRMKTAE